jgi:hypothetical protein
VCNAATGATVAHLPEPRSTFPCRFSNLLATCRSSREPLDGGSLGHHVIALRPSSFARTAYWLPAMKSPVKYSSSVDAPALHDAQEGTAIKSDGRGFAQRACGGTWSLVRLRLCPQ